MPRIAYGAGAYRRDNGNLPELRLINMFVERTPSDELGAVLLSRKGLTEHSAPGVGPVEGVFRNDGVFDGDIFSVSGGKLCRGETEIGTILGGGPVSMAASADELAITAGGPLYRYDDTNGLDAVTFPDGQDVRKIIFHDGLFIAAAGESQRFYWSSVLDADTWDALDFASGESSPDELVDMEVLADTLWLFGSESIEPHANTGDADLPYQRIEQRIFSKGIHSTGCLVKMDNSLLFVGSDSMAYRLAEVPERISDHAIEERIGQSSTASCFGLIFEGHSLFCIRLDDSTFAFDVSTEQWCELASYGHDNFRGRCGVMDGPITILGDHSEGKLWTLDGWDDDGETLERLFTAAFRIKGGTAVIDSLALESNVGWTELLTGQGSAPIAEMRASRDGGATWNNWRSSNLGSQGNYRTRAQWKRCGMFDFPGAMFEFRVTDPVPFRVSGVYANEPGGGRSR
jgi:hypothetical protein